MIKDEKKFWKILNSYDVSKARIEFTEQKIQMEKGFQVIDDKQVNKRWKIEKNKRTNIFMDKTNFLYILSQPYADFVMGINRATSEYSEIINIDSKQEYFDFKNLKKFQSTYVFLINAFEVYCRETFQKIAREIVVKDINQKKLRKFLKKFQIEEKFVELMRKHNSLNFTLFEVIPQKMSFQQTENIKLAFSLLGFNVVSMIKGLWQRIIENSLKWRHYIIHKNLNRLLDHIKIEEFKLDNEIEVLEDSILDIVKFVFYIESQRLLNYPDRYEINGILRLPEINLDSEIKKNIIRINRTQLLRIIRIAEAGEYYDDAKKLKEMLKI